MFWRVMTVTRSLRFTDLAAQGAISNIMICQTGNGYTAGTVSADLYINSFTVSQEL